MSLPDTAEYWSDIKRGFNNSRNPFVHIKGFDCGHFHVVETNKLFQVDCHACKKIISNNEELKSLSEKQEADEKINRANKIKKKWKNKYPNNPDCPKCGFVMIERKNKQDGRVFFGCCQYPNCKETVSVTVADNPNT